MIASHQRTLWRVLCLVGSLLVAGGCESGVGNFGGIGYTGYKRQIMCRVDEVKSANAMALAQRVLAKHGFRIKEADVDAMSIETHPTEKTERGTDGRLRSAVVKLPNRVRRTASLEFSRRGDDLQAWCRVKLERLSTADHRVFSQQRQFEDAPTQTPIERDAATTPRQNTVWSSAGRDQAMEQAILSDLRQRIQRLRKFKERGEEEASEQEQ